MSDLIIIGKGPAGISASLYAVRAGLSVTVVGKGEGALGKTDRIDNFYGFPEGVSGPELHKRGLEQAAKLGVKIIEDEIVSAEFDGDFTFKSTTDIYTGKTAILACGAKRISPRFNGIKEYEGKGVSYCAICDGFFFKGKQTGVLGSGKYAAEEASILTKTSAEVTIFTDGAEFTADVPAGVKIETRKIKSLFGNELLQGLLFDDGEKKELKGLFIALGIAGGTDFAKKLGAITEGNYIVIDKNAQTNAPKLFAAGDCAGAPFQIAKAVYEGAMAGMQAMKTLKKK